MARNRSVSCTSIFKSADENARKTAFTRQMAQWISAEERGKSAGMLGIPQSRSEEGRAEEG